MNETIVIIGGGIIGLNIAHALVQSGNAGDIYLIEEEEYLGHHTTGRNSEVLHAGIAYPPHSLKAKLCIEGNRLSREFFSRYNVPFKESGKWLAATSEAEVEALSRVMENAKESGAAPFRYGTAKQISTHVPEMREDLPLVMYQPSTAMIDVSSYVQTLDRVLSATGKVHIIKPCKVTGIDEKQGLLETTRGEMPFDVLVNSAGLHADDVYKMCGGPRQFQIKPFRGEYYRWKNSKLTAVLYPVPRSFVAKGSGDNTLVSSLGIHVHCNVAGEVLLGPSQEEVSEKHDYGFSLSPQHFVEAMIPYLKKPPTLDEIEPSYAGNRPKLFEDGKAVGDFTLFREGNVVHLLGMESPGLTAAPALGKYVAGLL
ncbi:MAG: hypothetical protein COX62_04410 [Deltaproteobacteria bacterium CG_4_10_14_0_2_um_filter_43_8]|nr:MAG: hypothetical protein COV43_05200 [Deltaproteobacteria bacterium CG11_big_fil_rev_8_21_14_0_20_42_23]PJA20582.1 MAG: hypothetical protein COX62_04410 [Deltaproteobacteria bacterium CG_4_10_14_0_2_um_filter_43_8]PJC63627.1 MAG: hypothetical protein CO021_08680 [Deltaproteobacteria bacterium CG_4_9_14_0_2_um_filter_42_21]